MAKRRLDQTLVERGLVSSRSQAESFIKLGHVQVNGQIVQKPGINVDDNDKLKVTVKNQYVSRAALKLESVAKNFGLDFKDKTVLDVGSSTGGFTHFALMHGANKVIAVDTGTKQMQVNLSKDSRVELHEQTDIRDFRPSDDIDIVLIDVSFISLRHILPHIKVIIGPKTIVVAMLKPQFETDNSSVKNRGVIKNEKLRRAIIKDFESWVQKLFKVKSKADSAIRGEKGNLERFYLLKPLPL